MIASISLIRVFFSVLALLFSTLFAINYFEGGATLINIAAGACGGILISGLLISSDFFLQRFSLKTFNTIILGLFVGYLLGTAILFLTSGIFGSEEAIALPIRLMVYLFTAYLGMIMIFRASDEAYVSIPFVQLQQSSYKKRDIIVDASVLADPRIVDLATSGLLDHLLIIPRFIVRDLYSQSEIAIDETQKAKARRALEIVKKLEAIPSLELRFVDNDFPEIKDFMTKLVRLARLLNTNIMTSDINRIQSSVIEGIKIINIQILSNALKPISQTGEFLSIKVQRYGKEPRQGVGYLEDGTMVVINGGAKSIGETIKVQVLSVKHTSSGRMIFCNTLDEDLDDPAQDREFFRSFSASESVAQQNAHSSIYSSPNDI